MATTTAIFRKAKDAGEPLDITLELTAADLIRYTVPAGGPFVTGAPQSNTLVEGTEVLLSPLATIAADTLTNPMTVADVLLFKEVSEGGAAAGGASLDVAALTGGFMYLPAEDPANHIYAMNGQTLTGGVATYPDIAAKWPGWISGANLVLPDWRGRAMMATGALGITGAVGATYSDATARNGLRIVYTNSGGTVDFAGGSSQFNNGGSTWQNANTAQNNFGGLTGDTETRPNAVGLVLCVIAGRLKVTSVDAAVPTSMHITSVAGNQTGNGFTANGVYRSDNTGPLTGTIFGNWTWRVKVTRFGDFVQQQYWNDTANIAFRESFDGGTSWTGWAA